MPDALIVAHGQPSDPLPMARELEALAERIATFLPGWRLRAATLAEKGAFARALEGSAGGLVFPLFMAAGWFTRSEIPRRLAALGAGGWEVLPPFGEEETVQSLAVEIARESGADEVLLAAHGSFKSAAPAEVARKVAARIAATTGARVEAAFIDQTPRLAEVTGFGRDAVCLPYFAMAGGHVRTDLPAALRQAGFPGRILSPLGADPRVPQRIADLLSACIGRWR